MKSRFLTLAVLLATFTSALADDLSQNDFAVTFINNTPEPLVLTSGTNRNTSPIVLMPSQDGEKSVAYIPKDGWVTGDQTQFVYLQVIGQTTKQTYCVDDIHGKYGNKYITSSVWSVNIEFKCARADFPVPEKPPEPVVTPVITNFPQSVEITVGETPTYTGTLLDSAGGTTATAQCAGGQCPSNISVTGTAGVITLSLRSGLTVGGHTVDIVASTPNGRTLNWTTHVTVNENRPPSARALIPRTVSAWIYDASGNTTGPGQFIIDINKWNSPYTVYGNRITELHTYGTDLEMYGSQANSNETLHAFYVPNQIKVLTANNTNTSYRYVGPYSLIVYKQGVSDANYMSPIIDGRTDTGYLLNFNNLSVPLAVEFADLLSMQVCLDERVDGLQIDIEPLDFKVRPGGLSFQGGPALNSQVAFYLRLVDNFSSQDSTEPVITDFEKSDYTKAALPLCQYKQRYVSVFTFATKIEQAIAGEYKDDVKDLLSRDNFLVIDSLYDLPPGTNSPTMTPPQTYKQYVINEVEAMVALSELYGINYKFAIPASCSFHECGAIGGYSQRDYVAAAMEAIAYVNNHGSPGRNGAGRICSSEHFKGIAIWAFDDNTVQWPPHTFHIQKPGDLVVEYLTVNPGMQGVLGCPINQ